MKDINKLLTKYWEGKTSLEEEKIIKRYFTDSTFEDKNSDISKLFAFFQQEKTIKFNSNISIPTKIKKESKVVKIRLIRKIAIAASILIVIGIGTYLSKDALNNNKSYVKNEITDQKKAREIAENALAMLAGNYAKGEKSFTKSMQNLEKINIINSIIKTN